MGSVFIGVGFIGSNECWVSCGGDIRCVCWRIIVVNVFILELFLGYYYVIYCCGYFVRGSNGLGGC